MSLSEDLSAILARKSALQLAEIFPDGCTTIDRMLGQWWSSSLLGDRVFTVFAIVLAAGYTLVAVQAPTGVTVAQAVVSVCFVPFVWVWRSQPVVSAIGFIACLAAWAGTWFAALPLNSGVSPWLVTAPMAVYATARYCADRRIPRVVVAVMFLGAFVSPVMWRLLDNFELQYSDGVEAAYLIAIHWLFLAVMYFAGARTHGKTLQAKAEENERLSRLQSAQEEERLLIARELHDVLAHSLTLIKVQANAGIVASKSDAQAAVEVLEKIRTASDSALSEVREIVHALRSSDSVSVEPTHRLADIPGILDGFRAAGLEIESRLPTHLPEVSALTDLAVTRIITEALTNVVRHQGVNSHAVVELECGESVEVRISSTGTQQESSSQGAQAGLIGLEERARSIGGTFSATGTAERFDVHASLPVRRP